MAHPVENTYDATRDPRTGRPILPIDADNTRKADAESLPLTDEDNQGIDIGDDDAVGEEDDLPHELARTMRRRRCSSAFVGRGKLHRAKNESCRSRK